MSQNLMAASMQWANRPADERFWGIKDLLCELSRQKHESTERLVDVKALRAKANGKDVELLGPNGNPASLTNWSFGQLCLKVGAPASYLRGLAPELAATNLNYGLERCESEQANVLLRKNGHVACRALTSDSYSRIWNQDIVTACKPALDLGWMTPPARPSGQSDDRARQATAEDIVPGQESFALSVKVGDMIAPAGVYCGDRDLFVFLVNPKRTIDDGGKGLMRGLFIRNSEVGYTAFSVQSFLLENVCGNHIVWGASELSELRMVHRGKANVKFGNELSLQLRKYNDQGEVVEERMIRAAKDWVLGKDREETVKNLFAQNKTLGLSRTTIEASYDMADQWEHTAHATPNTAWGFVHGLTRFSQVGQKYADDRLSMDSAGGKLLQLAYKAAGN
jgi:hypothetical protein